MAFDDGWSSLEQLLELPPIKTTIHQDRSRQVLSRNHSPDVPFAWSVNGYRGCEHGCIYCYARPSHAFLNLSPGLDFESRLFYKPDAAEQLRKALSKPGYRCQVISLGANTDPYQPIEKQYRVTRSLLEVALEFRQPVTIVTKGTGALRDLDLLRQLAQLRLISVFVSITSLDPRLKRVLEPRAAAPAARLRLIAELSGNGIPVGVLLAPVIPGLTDHEIEAIVTAIAEARACSVAYLMLRLPGEVEALFTEWLYAHYPLKARRVIGLLRAVRDGQMNDSRFGYRMRGQGSVADLIAQRFELARKRAHLEHREQMDLDCSQFRVPPKAGDQMDLLDAP